MSTNIIGQSVKRREDYRFLNGAGQYTDDVQFANQTYAVAPSATERECADLMRTYFTRHLLVAEAGEVKGVISMRDVIQLMLDEKQFLIDQLQTYIDGR